MCKKKEQELQRSLSDSIVINTLKNISKKQIQELACITSKIIAGYSEFTIYNTTIFTRERKETTMCCCQITSLTSN